MAIFKVINNPAKNHAGMQSLIHYVLQDNKVREGYVTFHGSFNHDDINDKAVCQAFIDEKKLWNKDTGRMCAHYVISFHAKDYVTPKWCLEVARDVSEHFFSDFQNVIAVHQDKNHLHAHIVVNSVSYIDGHKLHQTKKDLDLLKKYTNTICASRDMHVPEKGKHFDGSVMEPGEITAWSKNKYQVLTDNGKRSTMIECAKAILESVSCSNNSDEFFVNMEHRGWKVYWNSRKTHIIFNNNNGAIFRDSNLANVFSFSIGMEDLLYELKRTFDEYDRIYGTNEALIIRESEELFGIIAELLFCALKDSTNNQRDARRDRTYANRTSNKGQSTTRGIAESGYIDTRDERAKFDAFLADISARARIGRENSELSIRNADAAIENIRVDSRITENAVTIKSNTSKILQRNGLSRKSDASPKIIYQPSQTNTDDRYDDLQRNGWDLGL